MNYKVIGLMSGTSLDGLDIAFCEFNNNDGHWHYSILCAETLPYSDAWHERLSCVENSGALDLVAADIEYGHLLGRLTREFIEKHDIRPDFIASHGHTIFHQPGKGITCQIGKGSAIASETGLPVVCDFRSLDVALGGQGAPLVPAGDRLLFGDFDYCLNLGGFANISYDKVGTRIAYDICPVNIVLNQLASLAGHEFDPGGMLARRGKPDPGLLEKLNSQAFFSQPPPKSLGKEWVVANVFPILKNSNLHVNDLLSTCCEHMAMQTGLAASGDATKKLLITGGGALNGYLVERIGHYSTPQIIIPDAGTINFKEALIFAFLGVLRWRNEVNCLKSVTGATRDSSGGAIY